jgi:hypothetical protein
MGVAALVILGWFFWRCSLGIGLGCCMSTVPLFPPTLEGSFHLRNTTLAGTRHLSNNFVNTISIQSSQEVSNPFTSARYLKDKKLSRRHPVD